MVPQAKILELLLKQELLQPDQAEKAQKEASRVGQPLEVVLVRNGFVTEEDVANIKAAILGIPYIDLSSYRLDRSLVKLIPESAAKKYAMIPLFTTGKTISVGMVDPQNIVAIDFVRKSTPYDAVDPILVSSSGFQKAFNAYYRSFGSVAEIVKSLEKGKAPSMQETLMGEISEQTPVSKLVDSLLSQAVQARASDIHIEPEEGIVSVRFRVDGLLQQITTFPLPIHSAVVSRVKILSGMDITENRKPQDGKIHMELEGKDLDIRVSTFPTVFGENVVLRLLDKRAMLPNLGELGFSKENLEVFTKLIARPFGIILVTGPTGSGKTTTLYSAISRINTEDKNIVTIEDPVEFVIPRVRQTQVNAKAGITFANGLRGFLRQDPDVMMVGEIRDRETVEVAIQSSLTGHLVFSTLHTNDAPSALTRLIDMGIEPFLISSTVVAILAQRLVRENCTKCREQYSPSPAALKNAGLPEGTQLIRGKGCSRCNQTGFLGRTGIFELMLMTDEIKSMVDAKRPSTDIRKKAIEQGMKTLRQDGFEKLQRGITTLEEVLRVTEIE
ncbi:MAG TPA: ATPase, T2SS/T4P/T4SS family [Candidatus Omnitrophota bacterium]|mgnify:CR=1 FL=1|nr:ATPase, T2SS/T4P/T4SS family [Candidatus Omnitrophota bacterium]